MATTANSALLRAWLEKLRGEGKLSGTAEEITTKLKKNLEEEWNKLMESLKHPGSKEISDLCTDAKDLVSEGELGKDHYLQNLCKGIAEIKYFMSGVETKRRGGRGGAEDDSPNVTELTNDKAYARCIVGTVAFSELYGDHCQVEGIIKQISSHVDGKLKYHLSTNGQNPEEQLKKCGNIDRIALIFGRAVLGDSIKTWAKEERGKGTRVGSAGRVGYVWGLRGNVCKEHMKGDQTKLQQQKEMNKEILTEFSGMDKTNNELMKELISDEVPLTFEDLKTSLQQSLESGDGTAGPTPNIGTLMEKVGETAQKNEGLECLDSATLCERAQCVSEQWVKRKNGVGGTTRTWDDLWKENDGVWKELKELSGGMKNNKDSVGSHCDDLQKEEEKEVCQLIASGLKSIYEIKAGQNGQGKSTKKDLEEQLFKRTMRCVLLNAFADKLEALPCADEKKVKDAIDKVFNDKNNDIKNTSPCNSDGDKCFTCERYNDLATCKVNSNNDQVKTKVDGLINVDPNLKDQTMEKSICKPCTGDGRSFCDQLMCVAEKWKDSARKADSSGMINDTAWNLTRLLHAMKTNQENFATHCDQDTNDKTWSDDAHDVANKTACKLVAAGLEHISKIQHKYSTETGSPEKNENPYDNQEFRQFASCLWLKRLVQEMRKRSIICNIDEGIKVAFTKAQQIAETNCTNGRPCTICNWKDEDYDNLKDCPNGNVKNKEVQPKLEELLTNTTNKPNVDSILQELLKTDKHGTLCQRLQCLASKVEAQVQAHKGGSQADKFWTKDGDVGKLWKELSGEMTKNVNSNGDCDQMYDGRTPTNPEKKACQHLSAGFTKLKQDPPSNGSSYTILKNSSLRQTVGCLLLHAYAKKMKSDSKCVIDSGLKKAFDTAGKSLKGVECKWDDKDYDNCTITTITTTNTTDTTGTSGTSGEITQMNVTDKLEQVKDKITETSTENLPKINEMTTLCDFIRCAGPKWFKNKKEINASPTHTWCDFWDKTVKKTLEEMFKKIEKNGKDQSKTLTIATTCKPFGDGNEHSVERKACYHIAEGLQYIKDKISNGQDKQLLERAVACIALNMYADNIKEKSKDSCPIDESKIERMFDFWNAINSTSCSTSGGNDCFKCERNKKSYEGCQLSVADALVATSQSNCNTNATDVKTKMEGLLFKNEDKSNTNSIKSNIGTTLTTITEMTSSFCTQVQCAAKKYYVNVINRSAKSSDVNWSDINKDAEGVLTKLLEQMMQSKNQVEVNQYCKDNEDEWNKIGHKEGKTNKAACLLFASGLQHIYTHGNDQKKGPSFGQTMGCLFLKEYAKQLKDLANKKKQGNSWVHPLCDIDSGINYAFEKSNAIMNDTPPCNNGPNSCFECKWENNDYDKCNIGTDNVKTNVKPLLQSKETHMQETLENTVCPILLTDLLTPFLPLAPVSIGLSAMAYYLWKYFGPLGKGGARFRRSPAEIRGPSVQEQLLDHVEEAGSHEYRLVKERKPRSAPTRTKRSGPVNRRTIIEIHFEVLDECQKGDTQLNQKDFLELLVQEFMGSELMEEEQVPKEEVLMEGVPMELVPIEEVPSLGSGFMV
ncbi:SICAvar, type I [Plasmodium knowlesi strain H]|uniref:SICAvar, type I n=2 Tax=Plasmodium knowlesi TaxID=5850 RepID=A0A679L873_PLAKH|nr:SICAvar, type I [Plasmodium knowlesi strain H]OTN64110.1 SICAvar type I [Plasmodium knowlesi]CAA9991205.1 SICAvar, type I [Plasmodium knowlesi strain H]VVS80679.1 SICAvar, type I [Plasmodium knowlesi strain H]